MSHFIPLDKAAEMTRRFREQKESILALPFRTQDIFTICETFDRSAFDAVLQKEGCKGLRIYYGMDDLLKIHAIIVGVNEKDEDMIASLTSGTDVMTGDEIIEVGNRCPPFCPPPSSLNTP
jgi:hypothetical protein